MRIAFTSSDGRSINQHFGNAASFYVWEVGPDAAHCVQHVHVGPEADAEEDKILARAKVLSDCVIVYTMQIGGPAAAKLVARHIHPMKTTKETPIDDVVGKLQTVLRGTPPPWLRKAMGLPPGPLASTSDTMDDDA